MGAIEALMTRDFLIAALAAISAGAVVFTLGFSFLGRGGANVKQRIKRVALEREKMRAEEMARLRGRGNEAPEQARSARRGGGKQYVQNVVERFSLQKAFADENTGEALARAGLRGQGPLNAYVFARFVTPFFLFILAFQRAPASALSPYTYMQLVFAIIIGWVIFGTFPDAWTIAGMMVIGGSGLLITLHERRRAKGVEEPPAVD
jgi:tight adherence protein C